MTSMPVTFDANGNECAACRLHSMTLISSFFAINWMLNGPVTLSAFPILAILDLARGSRVGILRGVDERRVALVHTCIRDVL